MLENLENLRLKPSYFLERYAPSPSDYVLRTMGKHAAWGHGGAWVGAGAAWLGCGADRVPGLARCLYNPRKMGRKCMSNPMQFLIQAGREPSA